MTNQTKKGLNLLAKEKIKQAFFILTQENQKNPNNLEARIGILLCDIALTNKQKAIGLLEFYFALLAEEEPKDAQRRILEIIESIDQKDSQENEIFFSSSHQKTEGLSCISYEDFKNFIFKKPNFKEAFEDFSLSTKIVFSRKEELYEFLNLLIEKGYANLSLQYAENIGENIGFDMQINEILQKAIKHIKS